MDEIYKIAEVFGETNVKNESRTISSLEREGGVRGSGVSEIVNVICRDVIPFLKYIGM